ncbi:ATP-binding protein [Caldalkalibacillus thermarum]|uniref:ATP-binding protein n=1 Tax=Caldalkalibacillus thermarum TaxID=296745 RepID=UPI00166A32CC|nr:ATP-binding protein [Caldalkalibacillus thermarum]
MTILPKTLFYYQYGQLLFFSNPYDLARKLKNGIEAIEQGGTLKVELKTKADQAVIKITDTGKGMSKEQVKRLGTPYYSIKNKGTGLGTMVVYSIMKVMRGEVKVDSELGKGTTFTLMIPLAQKSRHSYEIEKLSH